MAQSQLAGRRAEETFGMLREAVLGGGTAGFRWGPPGVRPTSRSSCNMLGESNSPQILPVELCQSTKREFSSQVGARKELCNKQGGS